MRKPLVLISLLLSLAAFLLLPKPIAGQRTFSDILTSTTSRRTEAVVSPCASGKEADLPLPSKFLPNKLPEFQNLVKTAEFLHETLPVKVGNDPAYADGSGTSVVRYEIPLGKLNPNNLTIKATLYYQSIPPYYLNDRFRQAPNEPATQRLYYLTSNLKTQGTAIENWKVLITSDSQTITAR